MLPEQLGFGKTMIPILYRAVCDGGEWISREVLPYGPIQLDPAARVLHYSQEIFEGMKAYAHDDGAAYLFRPHDNGLRLNQSARRLCMPEIPQALFMQSLEQITVLARRYIPRGRNQSLYLRPFMIGVDPLLSLGASARHEYYVIASPSEIYHQGSMKVMVESDECRAAVGGTGAVKVGGNYAAAMASAERVQRGGYDQSLWLDPRERRYIEELSGMNLFFIMDGELNTPELSGSILPGITRDSLIQLAQRQGLVVRKRKIAIDEVKASLKAGRCTEIFACGTATVVSSISELAFAEDDCCQLPAGTPVAESLREALVNIQLGLDEDRYGWMHRVVA